LGSILREFTDDPEILLQSRGAPQIESRLVEEFHHRPSLDRKTHAGFQNKPASRISRRATPLGELQTMSQSLVVRLGVSVLAFSAWVRPGLAGNQPEAQVWQKVTADGESYQAIILKADELPGGIAAQRHAIVVDTSASQVGEHRRHALEVVEQLLEQLPLEHNVRLFALDVTAEPLSDGWAGPRDGSTKQALQALKQRVPLGATNLAAGLNEVLNKLPADQSGSILLIGDGQSAADPLTADLVTNLGKRCRAQRAAINSYGVGAQIQLQTLGVLAVQSGGCLFFDTQTEKQDTAAAKKEYLGVQARKLARAATGVVSYPDRVTVQPADLHVVPALPLPLRLDRETIYLSHGVMPSDASVVLTTTGKSPQVWRWTLGEPQEAAGTAYLPAYTQRALSDHGLSNGLAGTAVAALAADDFQAALTMRLQDGVKALKARKPETAARIGEEVRRMDDGLVEAKQLIAAAEQLQVRLTARQAPVVTPQDPQPDSAVNPDLVAEYERAAVVRTQKMQLMVSQVIGAARSTGEPEIAIDELKRVMTVVRSAIDINPEDRAKMIKQLEGELLASTNRNETLRQARDRMQQSLAQKEAQQRLAEQMLIDEERLDNLIDRVRALMSAGKHGDDAAYAEAQAVADVAINLRPGEGTAAAARFDAEAAEQLTRAFRQRARRADQFLETLYQVEQSHVPFPDEPPVRYPPPEVWQALTQRRKKWKSVDLRKNSPIEQRIEAALAERTDIAFADTSLTDAIDYLKDYHQIMIYIDQTALQDEGVDPSSPINLELSGITLRSALRLMLQPLGLTYVIEDEVMKLTTQTAADEVLTTRVYPVGDLVIPILPVGLLGGGGGLGGGGLGGGGLGGGGLGGGGFGGQGGGGFGGQGGGGFGGGFPSVPAEAVPQTDISPKKKLH
jgi:uncharacterized protein with von Willebrand factor type A (vWA) domain